MVKKKEGKGGESDYVPCGPEHLRASQQINIQLYSAYKAPLHFDLSGLIIGARLLEDLARTLSRDIPQPTPYRALRRFSAT